MLEYHVPICTCVYSHFWEIKTDISSDIMAWQSSIEVTIWKYVVRYSSSAQGMLFGAPGASLELKQFYRKMLGKIFCDIVITDSVMTLSKCPVGDLGECKLSCSVSKLKRL